MLVKAEDMNIMLAAATAFENKSTPRMILNEFFASGVAWELIAIIDNTFIR
jgi:hypothetical protein